MKKPFFLLEVLLALAIISLVALPFFERPLFLLRAEKKIISRVEEEIIKDQAIKVIKLKLLQNQLLPSLLKDKNWIALYKTEKQPVYYRLFIEKEKPSEDLSHNFFLFNLEIAIGNKPENDPHKKNVKLYAVRATKDAFIVQEKNEN